MLCSCLEEWWGLLDESYFILRSLDEVFLATWVVVLELLPGYLETSFAFICLGIGSIAG